MDNLLREIRANKVAALFVYQSNPVHDLPGGPALAEALQRVPLLVSLAERLDETAEQRVSFARCPTTSKRGVMPRPSVEW